ncbi:MAG: TolC family protein [Sedimentisphaerales bacterium]|nr:TolC family protein [Sedimentisphaerales bacterium]
MNKNGVRKTENGRHKTAVSRSALCNLFSIICLLFFSGCEEFVSEEEFYTVKARPEQVKEIDTLKLEKKADANEEVQTRGQAEKQIMLSIEQCRAMTLMNNLDLKVQLIEPAIAARQVDAEEAKFESAFFTNLDYRDIDQPTVVVEQAEKYKSGSVDLGVDVPLRTGGTIRFDLADNRTKTIFNTYDANMDVNGQDSTTSYTPIATLSISQPLLRGAGKRVNTYSIRILEYQRQITDALTKLEVIRVLANADRGFWRLYAARKELEVRQQEYESAKAQLEQTRRMVASGEKAAVEELRSEAGAAERLDAIIKAEKELRDRERELKQILNETGLGVETSTAITPITEPDPVRYEIDRDLLITSAVENRMEMLEVELQLAQDSSRIDYFKNQTLPLATLDYSYQLNGNGPTRNDAYDIMYNRELESHIVGMRFIAPLGNEAAKNRLLESQYRRSQRLLTRENRRISIELEVLAAIEQLEANWQSILASRQNVILAGRLYEAEKRQFALGLRTSTDVLDQQAKFANAQSAEIKALTEYQIAQVDLAYATGTLLGAAKVRWEQIEPK